MGDFANHYKASGVVPKEVLLSDAENWGCTSMNVIKFNYMWIIKNFSYCQQKKGEFLKSPRFSSSDEGRDSWCLQMCPRGHDEESKEYISLYLLLISSIKPAIKAKFSLSFINNKGEEIRSIKCDRIFTFHYGKDWGFKKFMKRDFLLDEKNGILQDDKLTIFCEISIITEPESISGKSDSLQYKIPECMLKEDLEQLFQNQKFTDVTLSADGQQFPAHKAILAARSPVFSAMFEHKMKEDQLKNVEIADINSEVLCEMLRYIYSGKVVNLENLAYDLLSAADKYDLGRLKIMCEEVLSKNLSVENVVSVLVLADIHSAFQLKSQATMFITINAKHVIDTDGWKSMIKSHPHLIAEIFNSLANKEVFIPTNPHKRVKCGRKV